MGTPLTGFWLGQRQYVPLLALQRRLFDLRKAGEIGDISLFLEHAPVITLGRGAVAEHLLESRELLMTRGIDVEHTDRGGEITVHAPGQLVCYPIVQLSEGRRDVRRYVKNLTSVMIELLQGVGIGAGEVPGWIGVWVDRDNSQKFPPQQGLKPNASGLDNSDKGVGLRLEKVGALGVRLSRWVTMHGFALNLCPDMRLYQSIVPCGISTHGVCSVEQLCQSRIEPFQWARPAWQLLGQRLERQCDSWVDLSTVEGPRLEQSIIGHCPPVGALAAESR